jgi:hypothetical protein
MVQSGWGVSLVSIFAALTKITRLILHGMAASVQATATALNSL